MKKLKDLYKCTFDIDVYGVKTNSKEVKKGDMFVCINGVNKDRHEFVDDAIKNGASCLVVRNEGNYKIPFIKVDNPNKALGVISKKFYDDPLSKLKLIGVTGTDGKTTTASIVRNMLGNKNCGYIGTNGIYIKDKILDENNTTPEINKIYKYLNRFVNEKMQYASMEVSSEALLYDRVNTLKFDVAILTNITEDHLNVHKTIDNYIKCKRKLFSNLKKDGVAILNSDDKYFEKIKKNIKNKILTYGKRKKSTLQIVKINEYQTGTIFKFKYMKKTYQVMMPLRGEYNVYNVCASILSLIALGYYIDEAINRVTLIEKVNGRGETINFGQSYEIVLDYAHTSNALYNILSFLNKNKKGRIITVTGSAGGREKEKRGKMGKTVLEMSDLVIFTMDDPRYESVDSITDDLISLSNLTNYLRINDRKEAIFKALSIARCNDIILIAGKGRDNYMAIEDKKIDYNDYDVIKSFFI